MHVVPEIGEEVIVSFENGNAEKPVSLGAVFNGKEKSGYHTKDNSFKVLKTAGGHYLEFEEFKNITLADVKGNMFHIDSEGSSINITALETINIKCKNFNLEAEETIQTRAGKDINTRAEENITQDSGNKTLITADENVELSARKFLDLYGRQQLTGYTDGSTEWGAKQQMHVYGGNSLITALNSIDYKAPNMNRLPEEGEFLYTKEEKIIDAEWTDEEGKNEISELGKDEKAGIRVQTRNIEEGKAIKIEVEELDEEGNTNIVKYQGIVDAEGQAVLSKIYSFEKEN
jgi:phage baseplate assembly protein gpV